MATNQAQKNVQEAARILRWTVREEEVPLLDRLAEKKATSGYLEALYLLIQRQPFTAMKLIGMLGQLLEEADSQEADAMLELAALHGEYPLPRETVQTKQMQLFEAANYAE